MSNKQIKVAAIASVLVIVLTVIVVSVSRRNTSSAPAADLPQSFLLARKEAAQISANIVALNAATNAKIAEANTADKAGDKVKARALIENAQDLNKTAYTSAAQLAGQLKIITDSLSSMNAAHQRLAYEAVATELSLVSEFVVYTQNLNEFLEKVLVTMETDTKVSPSDIATSLEKTNESAKKINSLNEEFVSQMKDLDSSF